MRVCVQYMYIYSAWAFRVCLPGLGSPPLTFETIEALVYAFEMTRKLREQRDAGNNKLCLSIIDLQFVFPSMYSVLRTGPLIIIFQRD